MTLLSADIPRFSATLNDILSKLFEDSVKGNVSSLSLLVVGLFFGAMVALILLGLFVTRKPTKRLLDVPSTWITDQARVLDLLDSAVVQRCKIRVSFHRDMGVGRSTDGTLLSSDQNGLTLEIPSIKVINQNWIGRSLDLSFRMKLPDQPQLQSNFGFMAEIIGFDQPQEDITIIRLSHPGRLEFNQNRQHLRVDPPEKFVSSIQIWTEEILKRRGAKVQEPDTWGPPELSSTAGGKRELTLENISGGGMRLRIEPSVLHTTSAKIDLRVNLVCSLTLVGVESPDMVTYYLVSQVLKCFDDCQSKQKLSLGLVFTAMGVIQPPPLTGLRWRSVVRDYGVYELDNWVYELHLELYRSRGQT
ncbi:hypothetical protein JCM15519_00600 [Fundidesulfovibrio butyratiphilus]